MIKKTLQNSLGYFLLSLAIIGLYVYSRQRTATSDVIDIPPEQRVVVSFLDIGQGDAIYIRTNTAEDILIDGGPAPFEGIARVVKELSDVMPLTDKEFDLVIASHNHADHIGGLIEVMKRYRVKEVWLSGAVHTSKTYQNWLNELRKQKENGTVIKKVMAGEQKQLGRIRLSVIHPLTDMAGQTPKDQHDANIAVKLADGSISFLLTGDLNETHEEQILAAFKDNESFLRSQILKVPHSGSKSSLLPEFLQTISPEVAIISVGRNQFGHPAPTIINKLESAGIKIFRTDQKGRVTVASDSQKSEIKTEHKSKSTTRFK